MKYVELADTGIETTEMCIGTLTLGTLQANVPTEDGAATIRRALDLGANSIDTAQAYGTYHHVAQAIRGRDEDLVISSKSHARNYEDMEKAIFECRKVLHRTVIDIFYMHLIKDAEDLNQRSWALKAIQDFKEAGAVRAIGASVHTNAGLRAVADCPEVQVVMACINEKGMGIADGSLDECLDLAGLCKERGKVVTAMKPLGGGHLIDHTADAINYVRSRPEVDVVAVGMLTPQEAAMNVHIFNDEDVPAGVANSVNTEKKHLIIYDKCKQCGNCVERCPQDALTPRRKKKPKVDECRCVLCGYCAEVCPEFAIRVI
jgi:aryl-alcohol dehydrogenase-like predicted oxidoreductase